MRIKILLIFFVLSNINIYAQLVQDFRVNDDTTITRQFNSKIGAADNGNFVLLWADERAGIQNFWQDYFQRYNASGRPIGHNILLNTGTTMRPQSHALTVRGDGSFVIAWTDTVCRMRIYDSTGNNASNIIIVSDTNKGRMHFYGYPDISVISDRTGKVYIAMSYDPLYNGIRNIYYQRFDQYGVRIDSNIKVNDVSVYSSMAPCISVRENGSFIISWEGSNNASIPYDIYMQMFDSTGQKFGLNRKINDDNYIDNIQYNPSISSDSTGNFIIVWQDPRIDYGTTFSIWAQLFHPDGSLNGVNFEVDTPWPVNKLNPVVRKRRDGFYIVGWTYTPFDTNMINPQGQRFNNQNQFIGTNFNISNTAQGKKYLEDFAFVKDKIISVWRDTRNGGYMFGDIYCNILSFTNPDSTVDIRNISNEIPSHYELFQNYPNPFNPTTKIRFNIASLSRGVRGVFTLLKVFDILGKEVATLVNEQLAPGTYEADWNASAVPSGIYFYQLTTEGSSETKKMILLK